MECQIGVISGDGIGPEIVTEAKKVLDQIGKKYGHSFHYTDILMGGCSIDATGVPLTDDAIAAAKASDAVLMGSIGGNTSTSPWYKLAPELRPEAGLLKLRKSLNLFANLRPAYLYEELKAACPLRDDIIGTGFDMMIMRELTGGLYFGARKTEEVDGVTTATDTLTYNENEIRRIAKRGFDIAMKRRKKVTSVDKANVLDSSRLWRKIVEEVAKDYPEVTYEHMLVDNCAMQLVKDPKQFDVILTENMFGVNNDIKSVVDLVDFISEQEEKIQQIEDRQHEIYRESSSRKRNIKTEAQYRKYQIWHVEVQEKLDELKQEKRKIKRQLQLADDIIKEDLYTAYYAVSGNEEIVADRDVEIPGMEEDMLVERTAGAVVESERNVVVMNQPANSHNDGNGQEEQINVAGKQQIDLEGTEMSKVHNLSDENVTRMDEGITDVTGKSELVEHEEKEPVDKAGWIVRRISELGGYENVSDSVKADIFGFDIADVSGSIRLFLDVMKKLGIKLDGDGLYEEFQRIYDEAVNRDVDKGKAEDKIWNKGRGR